MRIFPALIISFCICCLCCICFVQSHADLMVRRLQPDIACEVIGVDLMSLTEEQFDDIHRALLSCKVLVVRDQHSLSVEGQRLFSQRFGKLHVHLESASHHEGHDDVNLVSNIRNSQGAYIGLYGKHVESFHSDLSWAPTPTKYTFVKSAIRPDGCGDTQFADSQTAYEMLSEHRKEQLKGLRASYSYLKHRMLDADGSTTEGLTAEELRVAQNPTIHPIVTTHPITGKRNIFANPSHTVAALGYSKEESDDLLSFLYAHVADAKFLYNHVWKDHDFVIWDNRAVQHRATGCPDDKPRKLVRTTVNNDFPPSDDEVDVVGGEFDLAKDRVNAVQHSTDEL